MKHWNLYSLLSAHIILTWYALPSSAGDWRVTSTGVLPRKINRELWCRDEPRWRNKYRWRTTTWPGGGLGGLLGQVVGSWQPVQVYRAHKPECLGLVYLVCLWALLPCLSSLLWGSAGAGVGSSWQLELEREKMVVEDEQRSSRDQPGSSTPPGNQGPLTWVSNVQFHCWWNSWMKVETVHMHCVNNLPYLLIHATPQTWLFLPSVISVYLMDQKKALSHHKYFGKENDKKQEFVAQNSDRII